jgi:hypothetical protein
MKKEIEENLLKVRIQKNRRNKWKEKYGIKSVAKKVKN